MLKPVGEPLVLNETSSYLTGWAVPNLRERHATDLSLRHEYTRGEAIECDFRGIASQLNHQGAKAVFGSVVGYASGEHIETLIELPASASAPSVLGKNGLFFGHYKDLSLQHRWDRDPATGAVTKTAIEVSVCAEGARQGSHITQFYPSQRLLECQSARSLAAFARRYNYPPPPALPDVRAEDLGFADVDNTPALARYVRTELWPAVRARRQTLLKQSGYIAASKTHNATTLLSMSTPAASSTPAAAPIATPAAPPIATPAAAPTTAPPVATPAAPPVATPGLTTAPAVVSPDAMAEDATEASRVAVLEQIKQQQDALLAENNALRSQLVAAAAERTRAEEERVRVENEREEAEAKTEADMMINNCDAWPKDLQTSMKDSFAEKLEAARSMPPDKKRRFIKQELYGLRACSTHAQQQAVAAQEAEQALRSDQWASLRERQLATSLVRNVIVRKNSEQFAAMPPPVPFGATPAAESATARAKPVEAPPATPSGVVAASRSVTTPAAVPEVTQDTPGWAGQCFAASLEAQRGQRYITIPSSDEIMVGGVVAVETGVVRKSRDAQGNPVQTAEVELRQRFPQPKPYGLKDLSPAFYADLIKSVRTGVIHVGGTPTTPIQFDASVFAQRAADAKQAEQEFATTRRVPMPAYQ